MELVAERDPNYYSPKSMRSSALECPNWRLRLNVTLSPTISKHTTNGTKHMQSPNAPSSRSWSDWRQHVRPPRLRPVVETQQPKFTSALTHSPDTETSPSSSASWLTPTTSSASSSKRKIRCTKSHSARYRNHCHTLSFLGYQLEKWETEALLPFSVSKLFSDKRVISTSRKPLHDPVCGERKWNPLHNSLGYGSSCIF